MKGSFAELLDIDTELVLEFLLCFSRCEYALKRSGFAKGDEKRAEPDWHDFTNSLRGQFSTVTKADFVRSVAYLESAPPQKQILKEGALAWADNVRDASESQEAWLLRLVRHVRNNLFHGGKYPGTLVPDPERDTKLLNACLAVLYQAMELSPETKRWFRP